ncbi:MAG: hypothetical protein V2J10_07105, partial [Wenzhouxiangella sp.]|nr:hypothetical protein [Wenzhouxiangella sp.]
MQRRVQKCTLIRLNDTAAQLARASIIILAASLLLAFGPARAGVDVPDLVVLVEEPPGTPFAELEVRIDVIIRSADIDVEIPEDMVILELDLPPE